MRTIKPITQREMTHAEVVNRVRPKKGAGRNIRLQHLIIKNFDFSGLSLRRVEIYNTILDRCRFRNTVLSGALLGELRAFSTDFRGVALEDADIVWSALRNCNFSQGALPRSYFFKTDLSLASFRNADLQGASFVQCDLSFADFQDACLDAVEFTDCRCHGARGMQERSLLYEPALFSQRNW